MWFMLNLFKRHIKWYSQSKNLLLSINTVGCNECFFFERKGAGTHQPAQGGASMWQREQVSCLKFPCPPTHLLGHCYPGEEASPVGCHHYHLPAWVWETPFLPAGLLRSDSSPAPALTLSLWGQLAKPLGGQSVAPGFNFDPLHTCMHCCSPVNCPIIIIIIIIIIIYYLYPTHLTGFP
ncbi:Hypothetical predicted protein [Podarcis lilfordi]|uniref:Uncharacterized protein n=1 Tax=Podarcis lilfordi TaxID=74358 RepID=A0AA35KUR8_9SAUR|nr:Hypothetical predicted protein [Podarcis lilfordi]